MKKQKGLCECGCGHHVNTAGKRFINGHVFRGQHPPIWKGGRGIKIDGRIRIWNPNHPRADKRGYIQEHIMIVESVFNKQLPPKAVIHHIDGNPGNNVNSNLLICPDHKYHNLIHRRIRAYAACGHAEWRKCVHCKQYDDPKNLGICGNTVYHRECHKIYKQNLKQKKKERK